MVDLHRLLEPAIASLVIPRALVARVQEEVELAVFLPPGELPDVGGGARGLLGGDDAAAHDEPDTAPVVAQVGGRAAGGLVRVGWGPIRWGGKASAPILIEVRQIRG